MKKNAIPPLIIISSLLAIFLTTCRPPGEPSPPKSTKLNLKIPSGLYYQRMPEDDKSVLFSVESLLSSVNIFASDNFSSSALHQGQTKNFPHGRKSFLMAIPLLYKIENVLDTSIYYFGEGGGEDSLDDALVKVRYNRDQTSKPLQAQHTPVMIELEDDQIWSQKTSSDTGGFSVTKYLRVPVSGNNNATISITGESRRGKVMVCIIHERNGKLLALLNPKVNGNLSYTTDKTVFIIPFIVPNSSGNFGLTKDTIMFVVGDPIVNGTASAEEE